MFRASPREGGICHENETHGKENPQHVDSFRSVGPQTDPTAGRKAEKGSDYPDSQGKRCPWLDQG